MDLRSKGPLTRAKRRLTSSPLNTQVCGERETERDKVTFGNKHYRYNLLFQDSNPKVSKRKKVMKKHGDNS